MGTVSRLLSGNARVALASNEAAKELISLIEPSVGRLHGATITVGDETANVRAITIQLTDENGADLAYVAPVEAALYLNAAGTAFAATGGSTGIAIGTDGALLTVVAKKLFKLTSEADGDIDLTWTDTGTEVAFLGLHMPNGTIVMSTALTNA